MSFYGIEVFLRPIFLVLVAMAAFSTWIGLKMVRMQKREGNVTDIPLGAGQLVFLGLIAIFALGIVAFSQDLMFRGRIFPMSVGIIALIAAGASPRGPTPRATTRS